MENKWQLHLNDMNSASSTLVPSSGIVLLDLIPFFWGGGGFKLVYLLNVLDQVTCRPSQQQFLDQTMIPFLVEPAYLVVLLITLPHPHPYCIHDSIDKIP